MFVGNHTEEIVCYRNGAVLENVDSFQYLGRVITNNSNDTEPVEKLISKGWSAYNKVKKFKDRKTPMSTTTTKKHLKYTFYHALWMVQKQ